MGFKKKKKSRRGWTQTYPRRERERSEGTEGTASTATVYGARRLTDPPDLAPATIYGFQLSQYQTLNFHRRLSKSVFFFLYFFFFSTVGMSTMSELCHTVLEKQKKKKKKRHPTNTRVQRVVLVSVSDTCRTSVCGQKWRVGAT